MKGDKGDTGAQGLQGIPGITGERGPQGIQGVKGDTGPKGATGDQGLQGIDGPKGDTGVAGVSGYERVAGAADTWAPAAGAIKYEVQCPAPKKVLGGGVVTDNSLMSISSSGPTSDTMWEVIVSNKAGYQVPFRVYAICASV
jgi:hypothetical protein